MSPTGSGGDPTPTTAGVNWNNINSQNEASLITGGTGTSLNGLVTTDGTSSGINITLSGAWRSSGFNFGGLNEDTPGLSMFGETIGLTSATQDYFFAQGTETATLTLSGLDITKTYDLQMFGTRNNTQTRITTYTVTDLTGSSPMNLQTSGTGISNGSTAFPNGNNSSTALFEGLVPNASGQISVTLVSQNNTFGYLGVLGIQEVPEPSTSALAALAGLLVIGRRRRA